MHDGKVRGSEQVSLGRSEHYFYLSGISRGRAEGIGRCADQLQTIGGAYQAEIDGAPGEPDWRAACKRMADQFLALAGQLREVVGSEQNSASANLQAAIDAKLQKAREPISVSLDLKGQVDQGLG